MDDEVECDCEEGAPAWLATFSDLATLLLTFFVLLLSFAQLDVAQFQDALGSIRDAFGVQHVTRGRFEALSSTPVSLSDMPSSPMTGMTQSETQALEDVKEMVHERGLDDDVDVVMSNRGVVIRIRDKVLFASGSDELVPEARPVLTKVGELAKVFTRGVIIEGHTDDRPIHTARFPSNWELSGGRASQVLRFVVNETHVDRSRLSIAGYADTHPLVPNDSDEHRARNRRVEFVFERPPPPPPPAPDAQAPARPRTNSTFLLDDPLMPRGSRVLPESANRQPDAGEPPASAAPDAAVVASDAAVSGEAPTADDLLGAAAHDASVATTEAEAVEAAITDAGAVGGE
ncbi:MAG: OmpA family protein [Deltaproteobacteria bacterium]|nr:OmpA family protein [Deltaproteobacteria bacterium]